MSKYLAGITVAAAVAYLVFSVVDIKLGVSAKIAGYLPNVNG